jgi:hypothetical protein
MSDKPKKFYVHYTVENNGAPQVLVAGPYNEDEVIEHRRDIAGYAYVSNCFVSEEAKS